MYFANYQRQKLIVLLNQPLGWFFVSVDENLGQRKNTMPESNDLKKLNSLLKTTSKINQEIVISTDENKLCQKICRYLLEIEGHQMIWIGLRKAEDKKFTPIAIIGHNRDFIKNVKNTWKEYGLGDCATGLALKRGIHFINQDLKNEKRFVPWDNKAIEEGFLSAAVFPIKYHNDVIGTLHIYSDINNYFLKEELSFLREVAGDIGIGIKNLRDEKELIESKREYEELFKRISSCVAIYEAKGGGNDFIIKDFNQAAEKAEKIKRKDIIGKSVSKVFPGVKNFGIFDVFKRVYKTGIPEILPISVYKDDRIFGWRENYVYKLPNGNIVAVYNDLTKQKQAEEELVRANERLGLAQKSAAAGVWDWDMNTGKLNWTSEFYTLFGLDPKKDTSSFDTWRMILHPDDVKMAEEKINKSIKERKPLSNEYRIVLPSGKIRCIRALGDTVYDERGKALRMSGICIDITNQKKAEEEIIKSEAKYRELFNSAPVGFAVIDNEGTINSVNEAMLGLGGISKEEIVGRNFTEIGLLESKDLPFYKEMFTRILQAETTKPFSTSWRNKQGEKITGEVSASLLKQDGKVSGFQLTVRDITEQLAAVENLQKSFKELNDTLDSMIKALAVVVETKDPYTSGHQNSVAKLSLAIARELKLSDRKIEAINRAATIHDIGKIAVPQSILSKPTVLSDIEFSMIKTHSQAGYDILKNINFGYPIADIVLQHHEKENGSGYPRGLMGPDIMIEAKIIAVADIVEAMSSHRPYRPAIGMKEAIREIEANKNTLYDSSAVDACIRIFNKGFKF
jgi:PAS domain S-box-containing protein/putative nucleotidyltransferase with HDIG domain